MQHLYVFAKSFLALACLILFLSIAGFAQTTTFTYKGQLNDVAGMPASGNYEMQFKLFDDATLGKQISSTLTFDGAGSNPAPVMVKDGVFTVQLDFGETAFPGEDRYLEVAVIYPGETKFTPLSRQQFTSKPYAIRSLSAKRADNAALADMATNARQLDGVAASQYVQTGDARLSDSRPPTPLSKDYIQNTMSPQSSANFSILGDGTVSGTLAGNTVSATRQYNIGVERVLSTAGQNNLFAGIYSGFNNPTAADNSFFGAYAGFRNTTGSDNSFFGAFAGSVNTAGSYNLFFGALAGGSNTTGHSNSFFGKEAGSANTTGNDNSFFGRSAGSGNYAGSYITLIGTNADVPLGSNLDHATAIGAEAIVRSSNTVVLGRDIDTVQVPGSLSVTTLGTGGRTKLCLNAANQIADCSSSLRYKTNIATFSAGLNLVSRLRPISFDWKTDGQRDVGFGAEEVAAINPLFVNYNSKGQVEGVKYDRLSVAFVNAFKEQQAQIEEQRDQIKKQQAQLAALKKLVCLDHPNAVVCK